MKVSLYIPEFSEKKEIRPILPNSRKFLPIPTESEIPKLVTLDGKMKSECELRKRKASMTSVRTRVL